MSIIVLHTNLPVHAPDRRIECRRFSLMLMVKSCQGVTVRRGLLAFFKVLSETREIAFRLTGRPTPVVIKRVAQPRGRKADSVRGGATGVHYHRDLPVAT